MNMENMRSHRRITIVFFLVASLTLASNCVAQSTETADQFTAVPRPMAPNAAALSKFVDIPVSNYTGTAQVEIPIFEIKQGALRLPISLNYHASGNRVNDVASSVGLGWALNAGGTISRSIRGLADETSNGFFTVGYLIEDPAVDCDNSNTKPCNYLRNVSIKSTYDSEPDMYFLNLPGGGGIKFTFDYNGNLRLENYRQIDITWDKPNQKWKVITEDGTQYLFGKDGTVGEKDVLTVTPESSEVQTGISAWHLNRIVSADRIDTIFFEYGFSADISDQTEAQETYYERNIALMGSSSIQYCDQLLVKKTPEATLLTIQKTLSKIRYALGSVEFTQSTTEHRRDVPGDYKLGMIKVKNKNGTLIKSFNLDHTYYGTTGSYRLMLSAVTERGSGGKELPPYLFQYNTSNTLPKKGAYQQDHWGFYNANTKSTLIPQYIFKPDGNFIEYEDGANREPDPLKSQALMLTKVTYPTGGYDTLEYELHDAGGVSNQGNVVQTDSTMEFHLNTVPVQTELSLDKLIFIPKKMTVNIRAWGGSFCLPPVPNGECERPNASVSVSFVPTAAYPQGGLNAGWSYLSPFSYDHTHQLFPGYYSISMFADYANINNHARADLEMTFFYSEAQKTPTLAGGVRIKQISRYDGPSSLAKITRYEYKTSKNNVVTSSGVLIRKPQYYGTYQTVITPPEFVNGILCPYEIGSSSSVVSLGEGTHIGYSEVKVIQSVANPENNTTPNGYEVFKYTSAEDYPDVGGDVYPYAPAESRSNRRGLLTKHSTFDKNGNLLNETSNDYEFSAGTDVSAKGLKVAMPFPVQNLFLVSGYKWAFYEFWQEWNYLKTKTERLYNDANDGRFVETVTSYFYDRPDKHVQLTRQEVTIDNGDKLETRFKYPQDYNVAISGLSNIGALVSKHILNVPIETQQWRTKGSSSNLIAGRIMDFDPVELKPSQIYNFESAPLGTLSSNSTNSSGLYVTLLSDAHYKPNTSLTYKKGRFATMSKTSDLTRSYLWGYTNSLVVAEAINADTSKIALTSFEDPGAKGRWSYSPSISSTAKSGKTSHSINGHSVTRDGLETGNTYTVSYWARNGTPTFTGGTVSDLSSPNAESDGWRYFEKKITGASSVTLSGTGSILIDELRLFPTGAEMTTYTYDPLIGMTSMTDKNNRITYYEYDQFGRLIIVRDHDRNILKTYTYHYKGE